MSTFALVSDPHITVPNPQTGWFLPSVPNEPTLYEHSVALFESAVAQINAMPEVDFVLVPGDLTKDSEPYNHDRARELLTLFRRPVYCVSGNHDQPRPPDKRPLALLDPDVHAVETRDIPRLYGDFGFKQLTKAFYSCDPTPDIHLVALCSPKLDDDRGYITAEMLAWLEDDLSRQRDPACETIVMLHHTIVEHVPGERVDPTFAWFHVENYGALLDVLHRHRVRLTVSGHLHIQDVKEENGLYNIVTSSLAGYPHAYRIFELRDGELRVRSHRLQSIPALPDLQTFSRRFTEESFIGIFGSVLGGAPFHYSPERAAATAAKLRHWWPNIANGTERVVFTEEILGDPALVAYVNSFTDAPPPNNDFTLELRPRR